MNGVIGLVAALLAIPAALGALRLLYRLTRFTKPGTAVLWKDGLHGGVVTGVYLRRSSIGYHRCRIVSFPALPDWAGREVVIDAKVDELRLAFPVRPHDTKDYG